MWLHSTVRFYGPCGRMHLSSFCDARGGIKLGHETHFNAQDAFPPKGLFDPAKWSAFCLVKVESCKTMSRIFPENMLARAKFLQKNTQLRRKNEIFCLKYHAWREGEKNNKRRGKNPASLAARLYVSCLLLPMKKSACNINFTKYYLETLLT